MARHLGRRARTALAVAGVAVAALGWHGAMPAAMAQTVASDARISGDEARTRFIVDLSKEVRESEIGVRALPNPYRVVIDLPDVDLNLPSGLGREGRGLVSAYRYGKFKTYGVRVVLDVKAPVLVERTFVQAPQHGQPARLVVVLGRTDEATFLARLRESRRAQAAEAPRSQAPAAQRKASSKPLVVVDPGHGGIDPGAVSASGLTEKEVALEFSRALRDKLVASGRYDVAMTREDDSFVALGERVEFARQRGADLFISIHADSVPGRLARTVSGATVYTLSEEASDAEARALAAKENRSDIIAGIDLPAEADDVASILIDLAQRETKNLSVTFASAVVGTFGDAALTGRKPHRSAGFRVLKAPDVPSALVELGYLTNPEDEKRLKSEAWRDKMTSALVKAVDNYFAKRVARVPF